MIRLILALLVSVVILFEVGLFFTTAPEQSVQSIEVVNEDADSLFGKNGKLSLSESENPELATHNQTYLVIIGVTAIIGALLIIAVPNVRKSHSDSA